MMEIKILIGDKEKTFSLQYGAAPDTVVLWCDDYIIFSIDPNGLRRYRNVNVAGIPTDSSGRINITTSHTHQKERYKTGKKDVELFFDTCGTTNFYIRARTKDGVKCTICRVGDCGLYLWMDGDHYDNCYASTKDETILLVE